MSAEHRESHLFGGVCTCECPDCLSDTTHRCICRLCVCRGGAS